MRSPAKPCVYKVFEFEDLFYLMEFKFHQIKQVKFALAMPFRRASRYAENFAIRAFASEW